jgi:hypothetical protein
MVGQQQLAAAFLIVTVEEIQTSHPLAGFRVV